MKYFKIEKNFDDQTMEELYNSNLIIFKYEDIIFDQFPLFNKYKFINYKILYILKKKK